jgi:predicted N-acetyltransferase YhbS
LCSGAPARYGSFGFNAISAQGYNSPYKGPDFMALLFSGGAPKTGQLIFPRAFKEDIKEHAARQQA